MYCQVGNIDSPKLALYESRAQIVHHIANRAFFISRLRVYTVATTVVVTKICDTQLPAYSQHLRQGSPKARHRRALTICFIQSTMVVVFVY